MTDNSLRATINVATLAAVSYHREGSRMGCGNTRLLVCNPMCVIVSLTDLLELEEVGYPVPDKSERSR